MVVWELLKQRGNQTLVAICNSNHMHNLMTDGRELSRCLVGEFGSCLAKICGLEGHILGDLDYLKVLTKQHERLMILLGNLTLRTKTKMELVTDRHGEREVNLVTALAFYSIFCCLKSLLNLEQRNEVVAAIGVEMIFGGVTNRTEHFGRYKEAIKVGMNLKQSEAYLRQSGVRNLVASNLAPRCNS